MWNTRRVIALGLLLAGMAGILPASTPEMSPTGILSPSPEASPTPEFTPAPESTPTAFIPTELPTSSVSPSPASSPEPSATGTLTQSSTPSAAPTLTITQTPAPSFSLTATPSATPTPSSTSTIPEPSASASSTSSPTWTQVPATPIQTPTETPTSEATQCGACTQTETATETYSPSPTPSAGCRTELERQPDDFETYLPEGDSGGDQSLEGNHIHFRARWVSDDEKDPAKKHITLRLPQVTSFKGLCSGTGTTAHADFAFDQKHNSEWVVNDSLPDYKGANNIVMTTKKKHPQGEWVDLILSSFDWGGNGRIVAQAEDCPPSQILRLVKDTDLDLLPDAWEDANFYWDRDRARRMYDKGAALSPNMPGQPASDGAGDADLDQRAEPLHTQHGDGLSAFEEYRAVTVLEKNRRVTARRDPLVKDAFVFDEERHKGQPGLFDPGSVFLNDFAMIFHEMDRKDLSAKFEIDQNGNQAGQKAIRIDRRDGGTTGVDGSEYLGNAQDFSVNNGLAILMNTTKIKRVAKALGISLADFMNFVAAHEIGHKLNLQHNKSTRAFAAAIPDPANRADYWVPGNDNKILNCYIAVFIFKGQAFPLETVDEGNPPMTAEGSLVGANPGVIETIHNSRHDLWTFRFILRLPVQQAGDKPTLRIQAHAGNLMDPVPHPGEIGNVQRLLSDEARPGPQLAH